MQFIKLLLLIECFRRLSHIRQVFHHCCLCLFVVVFLLFAKRIRMLQDGKAMSLSGY